MGKSKLKPIQRDETQWDDDTFVKEYDEVVRVAEIKEIQEPDIKKPYYEVFCQEFDKDETRPR